MNRIARRVLARALFARKLYAFGINDLTQLSKAGRQFAVISAFRPPEEKSKHENKGRHGDLMADIQRMGYTKWSTLKSSWADMVSGIKHGEKSILIPHMSFRDAIQLMRDYQQDGIVYKDPSGTIGIYTKDGKAQMAFDPEGNPAIAKALDKSEYSKGRSMSFGLQLVDQEFPWSGGPVTSTDIAKYLEAQA
jgi:hypothetical protein